MFIETAKGKFFDCSVACSVCLECCNFVHCAAQSVESVLPDCDCVDLLYHVGCSGDCRDCYVPKETDEQPEL